MVVLESKIFVFQLKDLTLCDKFKTGANSKGLCCLSFEDAIVLACPDIIRGNAIIKLYSENSERNINAHDTSLACMALNKNGSLLATASDKGTLIRIFNTKNKELIVELRRGIDRAEIYCLVFHHSSE